MNFNEDDLWSDKMNLRLSKLPSKKVLLKSKYKNKMDIIVAIKNPDPRNA